MRWSPLVSLLGPLSLVCGACEGSAPVGDAGAPAVDAVPMYALPSCGARLDEAPLRQPDGGHRCTRVGADPASSSGDWPDATGAVAPVIYLRAGGTGPGTMSDPAGDLAAALAATPSPATILLARGAFTLPATVPITRAVELRGVSSTETVITGPPGASALHVGASGGAALSVAIRRLAIRYGAPATGFAGLSVDGARTVVSLRDVAVTGGADGLRVDQGATVCADGLSVRDAGQRGVVVLAESVGFLRNVLVRDGASVGVLVDRSHIHIERGLVAFNGRDGVAVRGVRRGAACSVDADCAVASPCPGGAFEQYCVESASFSPRDGSPPVASERRCRSVDIVTDVVLLQNHVTGLRAARSTPTAEEVAAGDRNVVLARPGPRLRGTRVVIAGTRALAGAPGGDGLYVGPAAVVSLDEDISSDDDRGHASEIVGNARAGVLADGDRSGGEAGVPDGLRRGGRLAISGARVASNAGPGMFLQERALAERIAFTEVADNSALGLGVTSSAGVALMICDQFIATRPGVITPENTSVRPYMVGDGASMSAGASAATPTRIIDSEFSRNGRFGLVLDGFDATLEDGTHGGNRGVGNAFGLGVYGTARVDGTTPRDAIRGLSAMVPALVSTVRESVPAATSAP